MNSNSLSNKPKNKCVVRVKTAMWADKKGLHIQKNITFLRRQCEGFNVLEEDMNEIGAEQVVQRVVNLDACIDGVYEVVTCNERHDYETNNIIDYDYKLVAINAELTGRGPKDEQ